MKILHLTDLHLTADGAPLYGLSPTERLSTVLAHALGHHADADLCVLTGDLAHRGEENAYRLLARRLDELPMPVVAMAGNHDDRAALIRHLRQAARFEEFVMGVRDTGAGRLIFLDTVQPGSHAGQICPRRIAWLQARLEESAGQPVFVFMHHAPCRVGIASMDAIALAEAPALLGLLRRHGNVRQIFFGHLHRPLSGSWQGIPFSALPAINHQAALDLSGNAETILGTDEDPAYGISLIGPDSVVVHTQVCGRPYRTFPL